MNKTDIPAHRSPDQIVLLRGWMRDRRHWESFPDVLADQFNQSGQPLSVITPDLNGNGEYFQQTSEGDIASMCRSLRSRLNLSGSSLLIGLSMGGLLATEWSRQCPDEVAAMVLINSSMRPYARPWERLNPRVWPRLFALPFSRIDYRESIIQQLTLENAQQSERRLEQWVAWYEETPVSSVNAARQLLAAARYRSPYSRQNPPPCPALFISGQDDQLVAPGCSEKAAADWNSPHLSFPGPHDLPLARPERLSTAIADWYKAISAT